MSPTAATEVPNWLVSAFVIEIPAGLFPRAMSLYPAWGGINIRNSINVSNAYTEVHEQSNALLAVILDCLFEDVAHLPHDVARGERVHRL
jgi:hypothetical protein